MSDFVVSSKVKGAYSVHFIDDLQTHMRQLAAGAKVIFIVDEKVDRLFSDALAPENPSVRRILIECSEEHKTIDYCKEVIRRLIAANVRKDDCLVAVGGGITQDIVAFISSILFRGQDWKFYPTTLLAQCDSCIGSKSSINFDHFKNLLGTFNPPSEIFIYPGFLETLSESEIRSGIGEMMHYFLSEGIGLAQEVSDRFEQVLHDRSALPYLIENSLRIKRAIIQVDEFDTSIRHIFNYGHTFGHAIEAITHYAIPHGQAVTIGMDLANYISLQRGMIDRTQFDRMHAILEKNTPSFAFTESNIESYFQALSKDKKNKGNKLGCILTFGPGKLEKVFIDMDESLRNTILQYSETYHS